MQKITKEPVYLQICNILRSLIDKGEYKPGKKFLSEREVSAKFDVSRTTANKSLSSLVGEGVLLYKKGIGTFVSETITSISASVQTFLSGSEKLTFTIKVFCERPFDEIPESIQNVFDNEKPIYYIMAVYMIDETPILITRKYINSSYLISSGETFLTKDYFDYQLITKDISLTTLKKNDAPLLKSNEGDPLYLIKDELIKGDSLIYDVAIFRTDCISFVMDKSGKLLIKFED